MEIDRALHRIRDYYWGCIYVNDDKKKATSTRVGPGPVWPSHCWVSIQVRHARLVAEEDADVELVVDIRGEAAENSGYETVVDVPSGVLSIGDADDHDILRLAPGRWLLQVDLDSPDDAVLVRITLSPTLVA